VTAGARIRRTQAALGGALAAAALLWGVSAAVGALALAGIADRLVGLERWLRAPILPAAVALGMLTAAWLLWQARAVRSREAVALWIEERDPVWRYALVTAVDPRWAGNARLEAAVAGRSWRPLVGRAAARALAPPLAIALSAVILLATLPDATVARITAPRVGDVLDRPAVAPDASRLAPLVVRVEPPAYSGLPAVVLEDPVTVRGLAGSRVVVQGRGDTSGLAIRLDADALTARHQGGRWMAAFAMPETASPLFLEDGAGRRVLALEPSRDSVPLVTLAAPVRDTILRSPAGLVRVAARAADDFGLGELRVEYIVSAGEGEIFRFRSGTLARVGGAGPSAEVRVALSLDSLEVEHGDVIHLRAVATDRNDVTGPGVGVSETRTLRVARADEYDSVSVEALPPTASDTSLISQRLLIMLAEALEERRPRLERATVVEESRAIARDQAGLRRRVAEVIFMRLGDEEEGEHAHDEGDEDDDLTPEELLAAAEAATEEGTDALDFHGDESPVVAVNRPLLEAYNAMWQAGGELEVGEPGHALPHMYAALDAIQRARRAERVYLRGRPPRVVVDLPRVRLAGERAGVASAGRSARDAVDRGATLAARLDAALAMLVTNRAAAVDSLLLLRLEVIDVVPALAAALGDAVAALRRGDDATPALVAARRSLGRTPVAVDSLPAWGLLP